MKVISVIIAKYCLWMGNYGYNLKCPQANIRKGDKMSKRIILGVNISARTQAVPNGKRFLHNSAATFGPGLDCMRRPTAVVRRADC